MEQYDYLKNGWCQKKLFGGLNKLSIMQFRQSYIFYLNQVQQTFNLPPPRKQIFFHNKQQKSFDVFHNLPTSKLIPINPCDS